MLRGSHFTSFSNDDLDAPIPTHDKNSVEFGLKPPVAYFARSPCDVHGRIKLPKNDIGRDGIFCDNPNNPLNSVCINRLPPDFCPSVRPRTSYLPPKWRPAFVRKEWDNPNGAQQFVMNTPASMPGMPDATSMSPHDEEKYVIADEGDPVCATTAESADQEDANNSEQRTNGDGHWGQPWCVTPTALHRYMMGHPGWFDVHCSASTAPRLGVFGAMCSAKENAALATEQLDREEGTTQYYHHLDKMQKVDLQPDTAKPLTEEPPTDRSTEPPMASDVASSGSLPSVYGAPDPYVTSGGLGFDDWNLRDVRPMVPPGGDFGVYGGAHFGSFIEMGRNFF